MSPASAAGPWVKVAVQLPLAEALTYAVPTGMDLLIGHSVLVPVGGRKVAGTVVALLDAPDVPRVRPVARLLDPEPAVDASQLRFLQWAADYYSAGLGEVIGTALPAAYRARTRRVFMPTEAGIEALAVGGLEEDTRTTLLRELVAHPGRTMRGLQRRLHGELKADAVRRAVEALLRRSYAAAEDQETGSMGRAITQVRVVGEPELDALRLGARMRGVLVALLDAGVPLGLPRLVAMEGTGARDAVRRLEAKGLVQTERVEDRTALAAAPVARDTPPDPTEEQQAALDALAQAQAGTFLLHGVTGSGKTEVYLQAAARVLAQGKSVLLLVPEIGLTPQLVHRVRARFGDRVAVLHSGLTGRERLREWRRIRAGEATVAVGARSALFAPFPELGLIVVDEEHDDSYKQDDGVRYHARDLAVVRAHQAGCPVVLGSATPSMESWANAQAERYTRLRLTRRATPRAIPPVELVDMRGRPGSQVLSDELLAALSDTLAAGAKAIVLFNRRGYAPVVECPGCGGHFSCPSCGVNMVFHQRQRRIRCHYCAFHRPYQPDCTVCGTELEVQGHGTQRVEETLREAFPDAGIVRMDADTTRQRGAHHALLEQFKQPGMNILVGTQLVAKGHDIASVQLSAVVGVDHILTMPDFRSAERTWSLVTQLAGRAGRGDAAGRVLVQTRHTDHFVFRLLGDPETTAHQDAFYEAELRQRSLMQTPPISRLVLVRIEGADRGTTEQRARELARALRDRAGPSDGPNAVLGPSPAPLSRLVGRWRYQIVMRGLSRPALRRWLRQARGLVAKAGGRGVRVVVDVDPRSLL